MQPFKFWFEFEVECGNCAGFDFEVGNCLGFVAFWDGSDVVSTCGYLIDFVCSFRIVYFGVFCGADDGYFAGNDWEIGDRIGEVAFYTGCACTRCQIEKFGEDKLFKNGYVRRAPPAKANLYLLLCIRWWATGSILCRRTQVEWGSPQQCETGSGFRTTGRNSGRLLNAICGCENCEWNAQNRRFVHALKKQKQCSGWYHAGENCVATGLQRVHASIRNTSDSNCL